MDRTSILGDAIDYMKELLDKINKLQDEEQELGNSNNSHHSKLFGDLKDLNANEPLVRNSPKVQRYFTLLLFFSFYILALVFMNCYKQTPCLFNKSFCNSVYVLHSLK